MATKQKTFQLGPEQLALLDISDISAAPTVTATPVLPPRRASDMETLPTSAAATPSPDPADAEKPRSVQEEMGGLPVDLDPETRDKLEAIGLEPGAHKRTHARPPAAFEHSQPLHTGGDAPLGIPSHVGARLARELLLKDYGLGPDADLRSDDRERVARARAREQRRTQTSTE